MELDERIKNISDSIENLKNNIANMQKQIQDSDRYLVYLSGQLDALRSLKEEESKKDSEETKND